MEYTNNPNQVVFLKDSDIVSSLDSFTVTANGVASYDVAYNLCTEINGLDGRTTTEFQNTSSYINDTVSANLHEEISGLSTQTKTLSGNLKDEIDGIKADVKGGVNYKGHLKLDALTEPQYLSTYVAFLHGYQYSGGEVNVPEDVAATKLNNGWMYYISMNSALTSYTTKGDPGIKFVPGNYIIVHAHNSEGGTDTEASCVVLSDLKRENIDIIQVTDSDLVRFSNLSATSAALENKYDPICATLSDAVTSLTSDVGYISTATDSKVSVVTYNNAGQQTAALSIDKLVINKMPAAQYVRLSNDNNIDDNQLYFMSDEEMNAMGKRIVSVGSPTDGMDVANKQYVDSVSTSISNSLTTGLTSTTLSATNLTVANTDIQDLTAENISAKTTLSAKTATAITGNVSSLTVEDEVATNLTATELSAHELTADTFTANAAKATTLEVDQALTANASGLEGGTGTTIKAPTLSATTIKGENLNVVGGNVEIDNTGLSADNASIDNANISELVVTSETAAAVNADNATIDTATIETAGISTINATNENVDNLTANAISAKSTLGVANKLTATAEGLTIDGILTATDNTAAGLVVDGILTASTTSVKAAGKLEAQTISANSGLTAATIDAGTMSATTVKSPELSATSLTAGSVAANANGLTANKLVATTSVEASLLSGTTLSVGTNGSTKANDSGLTAKVVYAANEIKVSGTKVAINSSGIVGDAGTIIKAPDLSAGNTLKLGDHIIVDSNGAELNGENMYVVAPTLTASTVVKAPLLSGTTLSVGSNTKANDNGLTANAIEASQIAASTVVATNTLTADSTGVNSDKDITIQSSAKLNTAKVQFDANTSIYKDNNYLNIKSNVNAINFTTNGLSANPDIIIENERLSTYLQSAADSVAENLTLDLDSNAQKIVLKYKGISKTTLDASNFIKDGFLESVEISTTTIGGTPTVPCLVFTWNTDSGLTATPIALSAIAKPYSADENILKLNNSTNQFSIDANALSDALTNAYVQKTGDNIASLTAGNQTIINGSGLTAQADGAIVKADNLSAKNLNLGSGTNNLTANDGGLTANTLSARTSLNVAGKVVADNTGMTIPGVLTATDSNANGLIVEGILSANDTSVKAAGKIEAQTISANNGLTAATIDAGTMSATTVKTPSLSATSLTAGTITANINAGTVVATTRIEAPLLSGTTIKSDSLIVGNNSTTNTNGVVANIDGLTAQTLSTPSLTANALIAGAVVANSNGLTAAGKTIEAKIISASTQIKSNNISGGGLFIGNTLIADTTGLTANTLSSSTSLNIADGALTANNTGLTAKALTINGVLTANTNKVQLAEHIRVIGNILSGTTETNLLDIFALREHNHNNDYFTKDEITSTTTGILTSYTKTNDLGDASTLTSKFETITNVDNLISNLTSGVSDLTAIGAVSTAAPDMTAELSAKVDELITSVNTLVSVLANISKNNQTAS